VCEEVVLCVLFLVDLVVLLVHELSGRARKLSFIDLVKRKGLSSAHVRMPGTARNPTAEPLSQRKLVHAIDL